jgi:hypothetical protein
MKDPLPPTVEGPRPPHPSQAQGGPRDGATAGPCRGMSQPLGAAALPRLLARSAAGAAAGCASVHGLALVAAPHAGMALLSAACLLCAAHLWRRPGRAAWAAHVTLTTAMLVAHPPTLAAGAHHAATGLAAWAGPVAGLLAVVALLLAAVRGLGTLRHAVPG